MDWLKLFALLITVSTVVCTAEGTRKKIRIHIPQKVKHIHHHKKIYITNHPASSQYAPAYLPTAESMALPTAVALPTVAGLVPLKPVPLYEERSSGPVPSITPAESSMVPQYQARGFYGPAATWESHDFDLVPPPGPSGPTASAIPTAFSEPSAPAAAPSTKRVKIIKVEPTRRKKIIRKKKPKRIVIQDMHHGDDTRPPVSSFHEQFYADLESAGTIRKIKKPKRVEKIIDGDTEHIHTYSEEHIHKIVFDDQPKLAGLASMDPSGAGITALASNHPLLPIKNAQALLAVEPSLDQPIDFSGGANVYSDIGTLSTLGTSENLEYANYNPREVTHDHVFHDHGEIPSYLDLTKEHLGTPPKASYTTHGIKMHGPRGKSRPKNRWVSQNHKPLKPSGSYNDFSYYENLYPGPSPTPSPAAFSTRRPQRFPYQRPKYNDESEALSSQFHTDIAFEDYRPIPSFRPREKTKLKNYSPLSLNHGNDHKPHGHRQYHSNSDIPFSTSSKVIHDIPQQPPRHSFSGVRESPLSSLANFKDPFNSLKSIFNTNNFEYDAYASPSNSNPDTPAWPHKGGKGKKKSISTQNISFGGQDHKTVVDHMADVSNIDVVITDQRGTRIRNVEEDNLNINSATPSESDYTITEYSPAHDYYNAMALKAFHDQPLAQESSNTNFQVVEAPTTPTPFTSLSTSTSQPPQPIFFEDLSTTVGTTSAPTYPSAHTMKIPKKPTHKSKHRDLELGARIRHSAPTSGSGGDNVRSSMPAYERSHEKVARFRGEQSRGEAVRGGPLAVPTERGKRYGDKLADESSRSF